MLLIGMRGLCTLPIGAKTSEFLEKYTKNRFAGLAVGAGITATVQSSSAVSVLAVGLTDAGLIRIENVAAVIIGANIGTCVTAQLFSVNTEFIASVLMFGGVVLSFFAKTRILGQAVASVGIMLAGVTVLSVSLMGIAPVFGTLMSNASPASLLGCGVALTGILQSSSLATGLLIALGESASFTFESAVYVIIGMNIGTCATAIIASLAAGRAAKQVALMHLVFNLTGATIFCILLQFAPVAQWIARISGDDIARQIANFHAAFNLTTAAILICKPSIIIRLAKRLIPDKKKEF